MVLMWQKKDQGRRSAMTRISPFDFHDLANLNDQDYKIMTDLISGIAFYFRFISSFYAILVYTR